MIATTEYERLRAAAGVVRRARGAVRLDGSEAGEFLQGQLTNDVEALSPGRGCYAALLNHKGKLQADMRVLRGENWFWIDYEESSAGTVLKTLRMYSIGRDVRIHDVSAEVAILSLIGPAARGSLELLPPADEHAFVRGEHGLYVATDLGIDVVCPVAAADAVCAALAVERVSDEAAECMRIETGRPRLGLDMTSETLPQEAGLNDRAVSFTKGCYVGQETVARLHYKGKPNRHLRGLRLSEPGARGDEVRLGDRSVGTLGSCAVSPAHGPIALALLRREAEPGVTVEIAAGASAIVVELPFS